MRLLLVLLLAVSAHGAVCTATGNAITSSSTNWDCGHAPLSGTDTLVAAVSGRTITVDANITVGNGSGNAITLTNGATLTVAQNITATIAGGISGSSTSRVYYSAGSIIKFSGTTHFSFSSPLQPAASNPPTYANPATITSDLAGGKVAATVTSPFLNLSNIKLSNLGYTGTPTYGVTYSGGGTGSTLTLSQVTLDGVCGLKIGSGWTANDQWSFANVTTKNTPAGCLSFSSGAIGNVTPTAGKLKLATGVSFDASATIGSRSEVWTNALFWNGYTESLFHTATYPYTINGYSLYRISWQNSGTCTVWSGNNSMTPNGAALDHVLIIGDSSTCISGGAPAAPTAQATGTVSSATSTTLTDSAKTWLANQFASTGTPSPGIGYFVVITSGTGAGQVQTIESNTVGGQLTPRYAWDTQPDTTSHYAIYSGVFNPHWTAFADKLAAGATMTHQYVMAGLWGAADNNGDFWKYPTCNSGATGGAIDSGIYTFDYTILFPSLMRDNSAALLTSSNCYYRLRHSTFFTGTQAGLALNEQSNGPTAGQIKEFTGNLAWAGSRTYKVSTGGSAVSPLGPWLGLDEVLATGGTDLVATNCFGGSASCADYNADFNAKQTGRAATDKLGSNPAYSFKTTVVMGTHDVRSTDPQFPNQWATPQSWAQSLGLDTGVSDPIAILPDLYLKMGGVFDFGDASPDSRFTTVALWAYLAAAVTPQNSALYAANYDGTDIGALSLAALTVAPTSLSFTCTSGGAVPGSQQVAISSAGYSTLDNWSASKTQSWLSIAPASGVAAGNVTATINCTGLAAGSYSDTITVASTTTGIIGSPVTVPVSVTAIAGPAVSTSSLLAGIAGAAYSQTLTAIGGQAPYTWSIASGSLCAGLSLSSGGVISGTLPSATPCSFTVRVSDSNLATADRALSIAVSHLPQTASRAVTARRFVFR